MRAQSWLWALGLSAMACSDPGSTESTPSPSSPSVPVDGSAPIEASTEGPLPSDASSRMLSFAQDGEKIRELSLASMADRAEVVVVEGFDPYYKTEKRFRAVPLIEVVAAGFGRDVVELRKMDFLLRAKDGYTVPMRGEQLLEPGGHLAFEDVDSPPFAPIGPQRANPAPFYLVWSGSHQTSLETHPRPWQLATIEAVAFEKAFPNVVPTGLDESDPAWRGLAVFRSHCILCHAVNREGGRVGPELNVPQSIVEYRPVDQIKAYIKDPLAFRYGAMPAHPFLSEEDLDDLIAYFTAMKDRKHDPEKASGDGAPAETGEGNEDAGAPSGKAAE